MSRRARILWVVVLPVALAGFVVSVVFRRDGLGTAVAPAATVSVGRFGTAPDFRLPPVRTGDAPVSLADRRGRPVVVNFWASWCVACRSEMPMLAAEARRLDNRVVFVGVDENDERGGALALMVGSATPYPSAFDPQGSQSAPYGLVGLPTTVFVSPRGEIVGRALGELRRAALEEGLARLGWVRP